VPWEAASTFSPLSPSWEQLGHMGQELLSCRESERVRPPTVLCRDAEPRSTYAYMAFSEAHLAEHELRGERKPLEARVPGEGVRPARRQQLRPARVVQGEQREGSLGGRGGQAGPGLEDPGDPGPGGLGPEGGGGGGQRQGPGHGGQGTVWLDKAPWWQTEPFVPQPVSQSLSSSPTASGLWMVSLMFLYHQTTVTVSLTTAVTSALASDQVHLGVF
jgi:hypothetical protein